MPRAPKPSDEADRLAALKQYSILDSADESSFDRITRFAAKALNAPVSLISLVDDSRQWFKSSYGISFRETHRDHAFCSHAILKDGVTIVEDASTDDRFYDNPLVIDEPGIRSYAGAPLTTPDGFKLGTLCVLDRKTRKFSAEETEILTELAAYVESLLELRRALIQQARGEVIANNLEVGVTLSDPHQPDNPLIYVNPAFCRVTGYRPDEVLRSNCRFLQGPESDAGVVNEIRSAIVERRHFQGELLNYRKDGTPFWNEVTISPVFDHQGGLVNFVGLQKDITESKQLSDELSRNYEQLKELERQRENLTSMIIHDLRSPLGVVMGYLELLQSEVDGDEQLEYVASARENTDKLHEMITSLLDVHRLEAGQMPLRIEDVDSASLVGEVISRLRRVAGDRDLTSAVQGNRLIAACDRNIIERVLRNLLGNAIKFTGSRDSIEVDVRRDGEFIRVSVSDEGLGIPAADRDAIFDKFRQVESTSRPHSTGLGLTFCKLAVEAHGGEIGVDSVEGKGSTFWFRLPAK